MKFSFAEYSSLTFEEEFALVKNELRKIYKKKNIIG